MSDCECGGRGVSEGAVGCMQSDSGSGVQAESHDNNTVQA
jgi:hypothetical protein